MEPEERETGMERPANLMFTVISSPFVSTFSIFVSFTAKMYRGVEGDLWCEEGLITN